jgi:hypothetical protein
MIITMPPVRVVQVIAHEVIHVVAVRDGLVAAAGAVRVACFMLSARVPRCARAGVRGAHVEAMLHHALAFLVMQVAVVEIVRVAVVRHGRVAAPRTVAMRVLSMGLLLL